MQRIHNNTAATAAAISAQKDSSRSDSQRLLSTVATHQEAAHILDMTGNELSRHLATDEDTTLPLTPDRQQQQQQQQLQQQPSSTGNSLHTQHCTSRIGSSLMALQ